jgi:hypothetical protein
MSRSDACPFLTPAERDTVCHRKVVEAHEANVMSVLSISGARIPQAYDQKALFFHSSLVR